MAEIIIIKPSVSDEENKKRVEDLYDVITEIVYDSCYSNNEDKHL